jgi:hypothetical protein
VAFTKNCPLDQVFAGIPTIYLPDRPPLPGDYFVTPAGAINQFMIRMRHSPRDAREILSNGRVLDGGGARTRTGARAPSTFPA